MGKLEASSPLRIWAGENERYETDNLAVMIYRKRLPKGVSFEKVRKDLINEIRKVVSNTPYAYWISPKAKSWM